MRRSTLLLAAVLTASPAVAGDRSDGPVARMMHAIGGADAPYQVDSISFTFSVEVDGEIAGSRQHAWQPWSGRHILHYVDGEDQIAVDWNIETRTGRATRNGVDVAGDELQEILDSAARMWVNDTYWLLMPYKLYDPGVKLAYDGEVTIDGRTFDKVRVSFREVGFTPGDTYWAFIARDTGLMERWSFVLEGNEPPPVEWEWQELSHYGPLVLSRSKRRVGSNRAVLTHQIRVR